jgi:hypothetical protein
MPKESDYRDKLGPIPVENFDQDFAPLDKPPAKGTDPVFDSIDAHIEGAKPAPAPAAKSKR